MPANALHALSEDIRDKRLRASLLVETAANTIVIDAGPDFRQQMLNARCKEARCNSPDS
ncbi:MAG: hypothetical protein MZV63_23320 [Marinilabiliales bacterium]|nr:hypothetical protein [Marinilabiliales bacterium]